MARGRGVPARRRGPRARDHEPGQGVLRRARGDEARPRAVLPRRRGAAHARRGRAADAHAALPAHNQYVLVRNLSQVDFWSFYSKLPYPLPKRKDLGNVHPDDVWMQKIGPALVESDDYLAAKLAIPLSTIFDDKS